MNRIYENSQNRAAQKTSSVNSAIRVGILIKAYGQLGDIETAFSIFEEHQETLLNQEYKEIP